MTCRHSRRRRLSVAVILIVSFALAGCGTRLDHAAITASAYGQRGASATNPDGTPATGDAVGDQTGAPGAADAQPGATGNQAAGPAGTDGGPGRSAGQNGPVNGLAGGGGPIVIATIGTFSGPAGVAYSPGARAMQVWASSVNARGGLNGRKVEVIVYDDGGDGAKARSQAQDAVENRKAVALVGSMSTFTVTQLKSYAEQKNIPMIGGDCGSDAWNQSPLLFTECASWDSIMYAVVAVGGKLGKGKKFGALICQEAAACTQTEDVWFNKGYAAQAGLQPVYHAKISIAQPDFTAECVAARNAGVEVLSVVGDPNTLARVGASCRRQNYNPQYLQAASITAANSPTQPGLSDVLVASIGFPYAGLNTPASNEFQAAWGRYAGGMQPNGSASLGWESGKLFELAATKAGADVTPAGLVKALNTVQNERLGGLAPPLTYPAGRPAPDFKCWFVMRTNNGAWTAPQGDQLMCR